MTADLPTPEPPERGAIGSSSGRAGVICLQGGRELTPPCDEMDAAVLDRCTGTVVVLAGSARRGADYAGSSARTAAHYARLGVAVAVVPDPRDDPAAALDRLNDDIGLVVMPGGSPGALLDVLTVVGNGAIGARMVELWAAGTTISGASAGAMVLCSHMVNPERGRVVDGLGLVPGLAVPHWSPGSERRWSLAESGPGSLLWGLPECGGVLIDGDTMVALGQGATAVRVNGSWTSVSRTDPQPLP
jgi:hypothetical protein